jgi:hypothetical protein
VQSARDAGASDEAIADALHVCALFNTIDRIADALGFVVPPAEHFRRGAPFMMRHGYRLPALLSR